MSIARQLKRNWLWGFYFIFLFIAILNRSDQYLFASSGAYAIGKPIMWLILIAFLLYSLNISRQENFFHSLKNMNSILWTRQIGLDLYLGLLVPLCLIYFSSGSLITVLFWLVPIFFFANLATFVYVVLHYDLLILLLT